MSIIPWDLTMLFGFDIIDKVTNDWQHPDVVNLPLLGSIGVDDDYYQSKNGRILGRGKRDLHT